MSMSPIVARPAVRRAVWAREPPDLEARLVAQVRAPAALRRALARVAGRMVAARGWERLGSRGPRITRSSTRGSRRASFAISRRWTAH